MSEQETTPAETLPDRVLRLLKELEEMREQGNMKLSVAGVLSAGRAIWGDERLGLSEVIVRLGVNVGKLCRVARNASKDYRGVEADVARARDLELAMGHLIVSLIRWADDLDIDVEEAILQALFAQHDFAKKNERR